MLDNCCITSYVTTNFEKKLKLPIANSEILKYSIFNERYPHKIKNIFSFFMYLCIKSNEREFFYIGDKKKCIKMHKKEKNTKKKCVEKYIKKMTEKTKMSKNGAKFSLVL